MHRVTASSGFDEVLAGDASRDRITRPEVPVYPEIPERRCDRSIVVIDDDAEQQQRQQRRQS